MTDIYTQHDKAFANVAAYCVVDAQGKLVARISFKFAASGLRTTCYFHILGLPMVSAFANGGGYDKASAAAFKCAQKIGKHVIAEAVKDQGRHWDDDIRASSFQVLQAV